MKGGKKKMMKKYVRVEVMHQNSCVPLPFCPGPHIGHISIESGGFFLMAYRKRQYWSPATMVGYCKQRWPAAAQTRGVRCSGRPRGKGWGKGEGGGNRERERGGGGVGGRREGYRKGNRRGRRGGWEVIDICHVVAQHDMQRISSQDCGGGGLSHAALW